MQVMWYQKIVERVLFFTRCCFKNCKSHSILAMLAPNNFGQRGKRRHFLTKACLTVEKLGYSTRKTAVKID